MRKLFIAAIACTALFAVPLVANAATTFYNISGIAKDLKTTFVNVDATTAKKVKTNVKLTNGVLHPSDNTDIFAIDGDAHKADLDEFYILYDNGIAAFYTDDYNILLNKNNLVGAGPCYWWAQSPTDDTILNTAGTGVYYYMEGTARLMIGGNSRNNKAVAKPNQMSLYYAGFQNYSSAGTGSWDDVTFGTWTPTDGKAVSPAMNLRMQEYTP